MNTTLIIKGNTPYGKVVIVLLLFVVTLVMLTVLQDIARAGLQNSAFYFSESFIFSSFWWLFAPLLFLQYVVVNKNNNNGKQLTVQLVILILPIVIHLLTFPLLVWLLSKIFYYHTYSFNQTFSYTLSQHVYLLILFYTIPITIFQYWIKKIKQNSTVAAMANNTAGNQFISTILVADGNKKHCIPVSEILYFFASPPYINIQLQDKKYLHHTTLKSILGQVNPGQFVRIHKSAIVNIAMVTCYTTRLNGDYDLTMVNNVQLRLSRNFAAHFKNLFTQTHRFATK